MGTREQVSYGDGKVNLSANRDTYIDLYQYDAQSVLIGAYLPAPPECSRDYVHKRVR